MQLQMAHLQHQHPQQFPADLAMMDENTVAAAVMMMQSAGVPVPVSVIPGTMLVSCQAPHMVATGPVMTTATVPSSSYATPQQSTPESTMTPSEFVSQKVLMDKGGEW